MDALVRPVALELTAAEALVLEEFLGRFERGQAFADADPALRTALYRLHAALEQGTDALAHPDYQALLDQAKAYLRRSAQ